MVSSHSDHYQLWRDAHRKNHMQWVELKGVKERLTCLDEQTAALHLREEEIGVQMAALSLKERELDSRLVETRQFSERLSQLVIRVVQGFMQQTQEVSLIKFLLSAVLFGAGRCHRGIFFAFFGHFLHSLFSLLICFYAFSVMFYAYSLKIFDLPMTQFLI